MPDAAPLSEREKEILTLVTSGLTNREIAQKLGISPNTVKVHISNIFEKTGVVSRTEASMYAVEHRIVDVPGIQISSQGEKKNIFQFLLQFRWVWIALLLLFAAAFISLMFNVFNPSRTENPLTTSDMAERWHELTPMPEPRTGMAAVAYDEKIYVIAGEGPEGVSRKVFSYSSEEGNWESLSQKPIPVTDVEGAVIGEKIFVPGGMTGEGLPTNALEIYNPRQDIWETGSPMPYALSAYALVNFEGKLYLFGGWDGRQAQDNVLIYDPILNYWYEGSPLPIPSYFLGAVAMEEKIVILGGRDDEKNYKQTWAYYPSRDANDEIPWESFINMPDGRSGFGVASIYDSIYVFGGMGDKRRIDNLAEWLLIGDSWIPLPVNQDYSQRYIKLIPMGSLLVIIDPSESLDETKLWSYQAFYYSVYIPITR